MAALLKEVFRVSFLKVPAPDFLRRDLCRNREDRYTASMGIVQAIDEVEVARATATRAYGKLSC
jgi:hypothetical protein